MAVGRWYDFRKFGWYLGNVGLLALALRGPEALEPTLKDLSPYVQ